MPRLIFVNRFYWPEEPATSQLLTDLAQATAAAGWETLVLTSERQQPPLLNREMRAGVQIIRIGPKRSDGRSIFARLLDFIGFISAACWHLLRRVRTGDTVVFMTDPPLLGMIATLLLWWRRMKIVHWVQDIYPEVAITVSGQHWLAVIKPLRNWSWRRAHACVTLGNDMASVLQRAGVARLHIIPNWAPLGLSEAASEECTALKTTWGVAGKFIVLYSGNLGHVHDLHPILEIADHLQEEKDVAIVFVGSGAQQTALQAEVSARGLNNVFFQPPQPRARLSASLSTGDIHLVTMKPGCEACVLPSKLHGIMAVARPVLFIGPPRSALFGMIGAENFGLSFSREEINTAAQAIVRLKNDLPMRRVMSNAARDYAATHDFSASLQAWLNLLGRPDKLTHH